MADPKGTRVLRVETLAAALQQKLDNEAGVLDVLVAAMSKGQPNDALWSDLHAAASRDDRTAELAFCYERLARDKRLKALTAAQQAAVLLHAAVFFVDVFGDPDGAEGYFEKAFEACPSDARVFERYEAHLRDGQEGNKLAALYEKAAKHRTDKADQLRLLKSAVEILDAFDAGDARSIKIYEEILKLSPTDATARRALEARYESAGKSKELAALLEQAIEDADAMTSLALRTRLIKLYGGSLGEIERALPHLEEVLRVEPMNDAARQVAEKLLSHRAIASRVAAILGTVYERLGKHADASRMLAIEVDAARGPKRLEAQKRLAALLYDKLGEIHKASALDEQILALDPADDAVRDRFVSVARAIGKQIDAVRVLSRALSGAKEPLLRARLGLELGELSRELSDLKKAKAFYAGVLELSADDSLTLRAGRELAKLLREGREGRALGPVLQRLATIEPDAALRVAATEELARLCEGELGDKPGAITAYQRLLGTKHDEDALIALERLYDATAAHAELAAILERRAAVEKDRNVARDLRFRAADVRLTRAGDRAGALEAWRAFVAAYGASREAHARLLPLLEGEKRWEELAAALAAEAKLTPAEERAPVLARLGQLRLSRLSDATGALEAHRQALAIDPADRASRLALDKLLQQGDLRLAAADVLEPIARREKNAALLVRVLDVRATAAKATHERLRALEEASEVVGRDLRDPRRALEFAGRGLREAVEVAESTVPAWLDRLDRLATGPDAARRAELMREALEACVVTSRPLGELARRTGDALVAAGEVSAAILAFRRALAFEPSNPDLLARVDTLLRDQGSPDERLSLYRTALEQPESPERRRELLHAIAVIERRDLGDPIAALATYRRAMEDDASDRLAWEAVLEILEATGAWDEVASELDRALGEGSRLISDGAADRAALHLRAARVAERLGRGERAAGHYRALLAIDAPLVVDDALEEAERVARARGDASLVHAILERRIAAALEPQEESDWLERLGSLEVEEGKSEAAAKAFKRAAHRASQAGDFDRAVSLYERVLTVTNDDREAAERLAARYRESGAWAKIPSVFDVLLRTAPTADTALAALLAFEIPMAKARAATAFAAEAEALLAGARGLAFTPAQRAALLGTRARVLASDPALEADASVAYRALIEEQPDDATLASFEQFLVARGPAGFDDRRWLYTRRVEAAADADRVRLLVAWADLEETVMGDHHAASDLYARALVIDPDHDGALAARARLLLEAGDFEGAAKLIAARRDRSDGIARVTLELELATLLFDRLGRAEEALAVVASVLEASPGDAAALALAERALDLPETRARAARLLERAADAADDPEASAALIDRLLAMPADLPELGDARRGWFERLLDRRGLAADRALDVAVRAIGELPFDSTLWERAERLAREIGAPDVVARAYRRELDRAASSGASVDTLEELGRRAVEHQEEWFDDPEAVVALLRRLTEIAPTSTWAFERLKLTYNLGERWDELFGLYDDAIARADDLRVRSDLLEDAALAAKDLASDAGRAIKYFEALLPLRDDARVRTALERLYERHGHFAPLVSLLRRELERLSGDAAQRTRARIAALLFDGLGDGDGALALAFEMLELEPVRQEAFEILERVIRDRSPMSSADRDARAHDQRARAAALLKERYRTAGRTADLVRVLEVEIQETTAPAARAELLQEIVRLRLDVLHDDAGALESVAALVLLAPDVEAHREELERLATKVKAPARLAETLALAAESSDPAKAVRLRERAAVVYRDDVVDAARAIALFQAVLAAPEADDKTRLSAARALEPLLATAERREERRDVLGRIAELERDPSARRTALVELARASIESHGSERAIEAYRALLAEDPRDAEAIDGLVNALEGAAERAQTGADGLVTWSALIEALEKRAERPGAKSAKADLVRRARLIAERLDDTPRAIEAFLAIGARFGVDDATTDALADLHDRAGNYAELTQLLEREASAADDAERAADLFRRLGDAHKNRTQRLGDAVASYELALEQRPSDPLARDGLEGLLARIEADPGADRAVLSKVVRALLGVYEKSDSWAATIAILEPRLAAAASDEERVSVLVETARIYETKKGDADAAFEAIYRAFELWPEQSLVEDLVRITTAARRWDSIAQALAGSFEKRDIAPVVVRILWRNVARFYQDERADLPAAEAALERALALDPLNVEILDALAELQRRVPGRPLVATLLRLCDATGGDLDCYREAVEIARGPVADRALAKTIAGKLLDLVALRWNEQVDDELTHVSGTFASFADAATWALDVLVDLTHDDAPTDVAKLFLRGADLPFDRDERRKLRHKAAELSAADDRVAIYGQLFAEDPHDAEAAGRLEALYRERGMRGDLFALRRRLVEVAPTPDREKTLRYELAMLYVEAGDTPRAISALEDNLREGAPHMQSVSKLAQLFESAGRHEELVALCERQAEALERASDPATASAFWARAAAMAEARLESIPRAIEAHRRASLLGAVGSTEALARLYTAAGDHAAAADVLERLYEISAGGEASIAVASALRLADTYVAAGRRDRARERLEATLARTPDATLRRRLGEIYRADKAWDELAVLVRAEVDDAPDRATRAARIREVAEIHYVARRDPAAAIPLLEQAAELSPDDPLPRLELAEARRAAGRVDEAVQLLRAMIDGFGSRKPKERALVHHQLALVALAQGDRPRALGELDTALRIDPAHPDVLLALARLALDEDQLERANRTYRALLLVVRKPGDGEGSSILRRAPIRRAEVLFELSHIAERMGDPSRATEYLDSAFEASRESDEERERLLFALRARGSYATLARALEARLPAARDIEVVIILAELADLYEQRLNRPEDALEARLRALGAAPSEAGAHAALSLARRLDRVERFVEAASRVAETATNRGSIVDVWLVVASALETDIEDDARAAEAYRAAELLVPASDPRARVAWLALDPIYQRLGDTEAALALLERRVDAEREDPPEARAETLYRIVSLRLQQTGRESHSLALLDLALSLHPDAERGERILRAALEVQPRRARIARFLESFARERGRSRALVDALTILAEVDPSATGALREAVEVAQQSGDVKLAAEILDRVIGAASDGTADAAPPQQDLTWILLARADLHERAGALREAADLRERAARGAPVGEDRSILLGVAALARGALGDLDRAIAIYEELRGRDPADREAWSPLLDVLRAKGDEAALAALIEATVPLVDVASERQRMRLEHARLVLAKDETRATSLLHEILDEDASQTEAAILLSGILERRGDREELTTLLAKQLDAAKDRQDKASVVSLSMRLGALLEQQWDETGALDVYHAALDWDPESREALRAIVRLSLARDDSVNLGETLDKLLAVEIGDEAIELALRLAQMRDAHGDRIGAEQALEQGYSACPESERLRDELILRYGQREAWKRLADVHLRDASTRKNKDEQIECLGRAADVLRHSARDPVAAADALFRALQIDPKNRDVLIALVDSLEAAGDHPRAVTALSAAIDASPDDAWLFRARASLHQAVSRDDLALVDLERAYDKSNGGYASELVNELEKAIVWCASQSSAEARAGERGLRLRLAQVLTKMNEIDRARAHLVDLTRKDGKDREALRLLAAVEDASRRWDASSAIYRRLLALEDGAALVDVALRLARACEQADRVGDARSGLERALRVAPQNTEVRERLRVVYERTGASRELADMILVDASAATDVAGRFALLIHAGRLLLDGEGDPPRAVLVLEEAKRLRPEELEGTLLLSDALAACNRRLEARALLHEASMQHRGRRSARLAAILRRIARVDVAEGDLSSALASFAKAFENEPSNADLAMELGLFAIDVDDVEVAQRAFRAVTLMKPAPAGSTDGAPSSARALACFHLGNIAYAQGDRRKAKLMAEKAVQEDPSLDVARIFLRTLAEP
jgi:tetratricopeptide (TPR) repeat protein